MCLPDEKVVEDYRDYIPLSAPRDQTPSSLSEYLHSDSYRLQNCKQTIYNTVVLDSMEGYSKSASDSGSAEELMPILLSYSLLPRTYGCLSSLDDLADCNVHLLCGFSGTL